MQVQEVEDGVNVKPDCAYIIPPNLDMALFNGKLHLLEPAAPRGLRLPIDFFFRSLADTISTSAPFASCSRAPAATAPWARGRSRLKAVW